MFYGKVILSVLSLLPALYTYSLNGREAIKALQPDTCQIIAKYSPGGDTVVSNGNPLSFVNQSMNAGSFNWYINGSFISSGNNLVVNPLPGVNQVMLIASNGICVDTAFSYIIFDGAFPGQYSNFQKQYHPPDEAMDPFCLASDKSNGYLLAGAYYVPSQNNFVSKTSSLIHIDVKGCVDWSKTMNGGEEVIQSIICTYDSGYLITAFPFQSTQDNYPNELNVFKLDKLGNKVWAHSYSNGTNVNNFYSAICETHDNDIVIEIGSFPIAGNSSDISFIKIDPLGNFIWGRKLSMENDAYYNIGGITEKNNFIYATGSISEGATPFQFIRSFLVQLDEVSGIPVWTKQNDPGLPPLSLTDIHNYKNGLLMNSYSQNLMNNLIYIDNDGNPLSSVSIFNPYGSLNGKENLLITPDNGLYFHQASGNPGLAYKDIVMRLDSNQNIDWQFDFSSNNLNSSGWYQLSQAPLNGVAGIGSGIATEGFSAISFLKLDSAGSGCNAGGTNLSLVSNQFPMVPLTWMTNSSLSITVNDFPLNLDGLVVDAQLFCPKYLTGCDLLKLEGPGKLCHTGDTGRYILHADPYCPEPINWTYDSQYITVLSANHSYLDLEFKKSGNFLIKVDKNGCNKITDSIIVSVGNIVTDASLPMDTLLCAGYVMKLDAGSGYTNYLWQDGSNKQSIDVADSGTYWVRLTDKEGCINTDTAVISSIEALPFSFLPRDTVICAGENLILQPVHSYESYAWSTGETGNSIQIKDQGKYTLQVVDKYGCSGTDTILVKTKSCPIEIFFPNAFTPNKDGRNDTFRPITIANPILYEFKIYNRWGQLVFETSDPKKGWDGTIGNAAQDSGSYVWFCTYQFQGKMINSGKGSFLLLR
jgi:gliding motility-associated-like protein